MLFEDASASGAELDLRIIYALVTGFCDGYPNCSHDLDTGKVMGVVHGMRQDFAYKDGLDNASPFKKAANFVCNWIAAKPLTLAPAPLEHLNETFALMVAITSLYGATLGEPGSSAKFLSNPIQLSRHSLVDIIEAFTNITPVAHFKLVSVLLEQMAYKTNPDCQYPNALD